MRVGLYEERPEEQDTDTVDARLYSCLCCGEQNKLTLDERVGGMDCDTCELA